MKMNSRNLRVLAFFVLLMPLLISAHGCSDEAPNIAPVTGKLTLNGKTLPGPAMISFTSKETDFGANYAVNSDGTFSLGSEWGAGIPLGNYRVSITPPLPDPRASKGKQGAPDTSYIPRKYRDPYESGFEAVVTEDRADSYEFDMKK
ncbi:MAG: carboxypeptidase-like regulatory domain-containing protein [Bythopirellula sp.]